MSDWAGWPHGFFDALTEIPKRDRKMIDDALGTAKDVVPGDETVDFMSHIGIVLDGKGYPGALIVSFIENCASKLTVTKINQTYTQGPYLPILCRR